MPDNVIGEDTGEFPVQPLPVMVLTRQTAEALYKLLNAHPLKDGEEAILVGTPDRFVNSVLLPDRTMHWLS